MQETRSGIPWKWWLLVAALWAALYLPGLGSFELKGEEGRRILPARVMVQSGDWILPRSEGKPYHRKPPLINWAIASSFRLHGGESEWAARLPSALAVLALSAAALLTGRAFAGYHRCFPLFLAVATLTCGGLVEKGRLAEIEALYVSLYGMAVLLWAAAWERGYHHWRLWLPPALFMGLASLAKGPVFLLFFYPMVLITLRQAGSLQLLRRPAHLASLALQFLVPLPWLLAVRSRAAVAAAESPGGRDQSDVWSQQILGRLAPERFDLAGWMLSPLETILILALPSLLALLWWRPVRKVSAEILPLRSQALLTGLGFGSLLPGLALALIPEPHARFQLPLAAPVILLAVWLLVLDEKQTVGTADAQPPRRWRISERCLLAAMVLLCLCGALLPLSETFAAARLHAVWLNAGSVAAWLLYMAAVRLPSGTTARLIAAATTVTLLAVLQLRFLIIPKWNETHEHREPARQLLAAAGAGSRIAALYPGPQPFLFYLGPHTVECASLSAIPPDTTHVLVPIRKWNEEKTRAGLARRGFVSVLTEVQGRVGEGPADDKRYVLSGR
jgi:4-amino-4-deoxy-L-arabinose transferase-like glycosyltransferase